MRDFRRLVVWQRGHTLAVEVCRLVEVGPYQHRRLLDQLEGAAISISANIAEAWGRHTDRERARFLDYAAGSSSELEAIALIAGEIGIISAELTDTWCRQIHEIRSMLAALIGRLRPRRRRPWTSAESTGRTTARTRSAEPPTSPKLKAES